MGPGVVWVFRRPLPRGPRGLVKAGPVAAAQPGMVLVSTCRGGTMDLEGVEAALRTVTLGGAGLDVLPVEPIDYAHPLIAAFEAGEDWLDGRLIITPHAAFYSPASVIDMRRIAAENVANYFARGVLRSCVNATLLSGVSPTQQSGFVENYARPAPNG